MFCDGSADLVVGDFHNLGIHGESSEMKMAILYWD